MLLLVLVWTSCRGPADHPSEAAPSSIPIATVEPAPPTPEPSSPVVIPMAPEPPAPQASAKATPSNEWFTATTWVPWEKWCRSQGLGKPTLTNRSIPRASELATPSGRLDLSTGSRLASWNGSSFYLGFAPHWQADQIHLHTLDIQKSVIPLVRTNSTPLVKGAVVVIDPGHGGRSPGAKSILDNRYEKEFTLDWALRIAKILTNNGVKVQLTRTNDSELSIIDRIALADLWHADLFISLHFNSAFPINEPVGLETYCLTPFGMPSSFNRDFEDNPELLFPNNAYDAENLQLAMCLHHALLEATGTKDRSVHRSRFLAILRNQIRPAVLIEGGFLSNPREARRIADPGYRQTLSAAVANAVQSLLIPETLETSKMSSPTNATPAL
jgi:N-acetylmuramoyl-L-alanine amidase